jgi:hypothetical protein
VARALAGAHGRYARRIPNLRGFGLFIAEPVRASPASPPQGAVYVLRSTYPVLLSLYWVRNALIKVALGSLAVGTGISNYLGTGGCNPRGESGDVAYSSIPLECKIANGLGLAATFATLSVAVLVRVRLRRNPKRKRRADLRLSRSTRRRFRPRAL